MFVWHSGEERGLLGSRYFADYPTVPLDQIEGRGHQLQAQEDGRETADEEEERDAEHVEDGDELVILLKGGTKKRQTLDIDKAKKFWQEYKRRKLRRKEERE